MQQFVVAAMNEAGDPIQTFIEAESAENAVITVLAFDLDEFEWEDENGFTALPVSISHAQAVIFN